MDGSALLQDLRPRRDAMLERLRAYVEHESPSRDKAALDGLAGTILDRFSALGGDVERIANSHGGDHVCARFDLGAPAGSPPALVLGHFDTVWPIGTLATMPFRVDEGRAHGPGTFDMKASLVLIESALEAIRSLGWTPPRPILVLATSDEEIGSPTSRSLIEDRALGCAYALVLEPPLPGGRLKTARKGVGGFTLEVAGRAAHAGIEPEKGASAIVELAHQVLEVVALADPSAGTTINVGVITGGSTPNVVPARAEARIDVRVATMDEARRIDQALRSLQSHVDGTTLSIVGGFKRPPMERTPAIADLFEKASTIARTLGLELTEGATGGASDGNFTAAAGLPTLDGLGCLGAGAHSEHEHILVSSLPDRAALLAALLLGL